MMSRQYGITPPISLEGSTPEDRELNDGMILELKAQDSFESEAETQKRVEVLSRLQRLAQQLVYNVSISRHMSIGMARDAGGKVFTFGSYRLGVYGPGSDIDALVVVPKHVSREAFFEEMPRLLRLEPDVEEIAPVPDAFVPIIGIKLNGIAIDLLCAKVDLAQIPPTMKSLDDTNLLRNIDEKDLRALNGTRVTDAILNLVPEKQVFKHALRTIKLWAQRRAIYANIMGFPGGVAWAMLVARICQLYPNAAAAVVVQRFFYIYTNWKWPQPVLLTRIEDGPLQVRVWNPALYPQDKGHRMPIITPAYPSMCATHNITASTQKVIVRELRRGLEITQAIAARKEPWSALFVKHTFFHDYKFYVVVTATTSGSDEEHLKWSGFVESKLRLLVQKLELVDTIELAHPFNKAFNAAYEVNNVQDVQMINEGKVSDLKLVQTATPDVTAESVAEAASGASGEAMDPSVTESVPSAPEMEAAPGKDSVPVSEVVPEPVQALGAATDSTSTDMPVTVAASDTLSEVSPESATHTLSGETTVENTPQQKHTVYATNLYVGIQVVPNPEKRQINMEWPCSEFQETVRQFQDYDGSKFMLNLRVSKVYDLPDTVYGEGEKRPVKTKKSKKRTGAGEINGSSKRTKPC